MRFFAIFCAVLGGLLLVPPLIVSAWLLVLRFRTPAFHDTYYVVANAPVLVAYVAVVLGFFGASLWAWRRR